MSSGITKHFFILQDILKLNILIDNVNEYLRTIFEIAQLAKLNVISKDILSPDELKIVLEQFRIRKLTIESVDQIYDFLDIRSFYNETKMIFVIEIPILDIPVYQTILLEPLIIKNRTLKVPATVAIASNSSFYLCYARIDAKHTSSLISHRPTWAQTNTTAKHALAACTEALERCACFADSTV